MENSNKNEHADLGFLAGRPVLAVRATEEVLRRTSVKALRGDNGSDRWQEPPFHRRLGDPDRPVEGRLRARRSGRASSRF